MWGGDLGNLAGGGGQGPLAPAPKSATGAH